MSRFGRLLRDLLLVAVIIAGFRYFQTRELPSGPAPSLVGTGLSGETVSLERFRGEPVIVYFWASWCGVCRAMEGNVEGLADVKVVRVAVASGKADAVARALDGARGETVVIDEDGTLASSWGVGAFPTLFWLDAEGQIRFREVGYTSSFGLWWRRALTF